MKGEKTDSFIYIYYNHSGSEHDGPAEYAMDGRRPNVGRTQTTPELLL